MVLLDLTFLLSNEEIENNYDDSNFNCIFLLLSYAVIISFAK